MFTKNSIAAALSMAVLSVAQAGTIVSAVDATVVSGGPGIGDIADTYNLFGLFNDYVSGVTDFDSYALSALHSFEYDGQEWFSNQDTTASVVSYDLGKVQNVQGMAFWNEDGTGAGKLNLLGSTDGTNWFSLLSNLSPTDNTYEANYKADIYNWQSVALRYVKLEMSGCPQTQPASNILTACGIGEVAFNASPTTAVPELNPIGMGALGLGLMTLALRRRRQG
ncbi:discoidin domain-containing protein [Aquabacterium sp.]|uniref:discoidin domain-containing protein n=1 Tax=Aquabacterium sp. TaxID=1872578 RepID=UPI0025B9D7C7|nr:discoidin domain-containing protein [Aquabacterium sp.]